MSIQKYPIGHQDFAKIISEGFVYVDKTQFVYKLAERGGYYFLSRPRRFGKSLLISTFDYLFRGKKELFEGLYIYDNWNFEEYPVIRISFSEIGYRTSNLINAINLRLLEIADSYDLTLVQTDIDKQFRELIHKLYQKYNQQTLPANRKVVILVDEYDKPLIDYLDKENLHKAIENRSILKSFYSVLKDADSYIKMVFITGVSKFSQVSIFSDLNNLNDLSVQIDYNELCGISQVELERDFSKELEVHDKVKIKEWYNGYRWNLNGKTVYNPFSILSFFNNGGDYINYWYSTGTPTFLMKKSREEQFYQFDELSFDLNDLQNFDIESLKVIPILFQTGYLTITGRDALLNNLTLDFPNREVKESYIRNLADLYIDSDVAPAKAILDHLIKALRARNKEALEKAFNLAFAQIPYDLWQKENEHFYHAIIHLLFSLLGFYVESEVHTKNGRADVILQFEDNVYCLEFKLNKTAEEAIQQINERGYLDKYSGSELTPHKIGINFSSENKKVDDVIWEVVE
jgi:hypothetical protein